ncbi:MAG: succinate dehydrogenase, hydrophobic membrane anchor protein [Sulfuricella sp.]|nr:succinate dehydrogenase, hydrophobic membrane anchor protein [Gammaproteobacteria bacterium]
MVNRIVTGAHYGMRDWLVQRVTAVVMALYTLFMAGFLLTHQPLYYADWSHLFQSRLVRLTSLLFLLSLYLHAWVGMRDIFMDYVKPVGIRLMAQVAVILSLVAYAAWSVQILWGIQ